MAGIYSLQTPLVKMNLWPVLSQITKVIQRSVVDNWMKAAKWMQRVLQSLGPDKRLFATGSSVDATASLHSFLN